jgi:S1-C subfamily serine protease
MKRIVTIGFVTSIFFVFVVYLFLSYHTAIPSEAQEQEFNTALMESTFKIVGKAKIDNSKISMGTMFIIGRPQKSNPKLANYVLVTAAHVLEDIEGDDAVILYRKKKSDGIYESFTGTQKIRKQGAPLYVRNPDADVAVMYVDIPGNVNIPLVSTELLADDEKLKQVGLHPGDELLCLGYPFGKASNEAGFPILRSGKVASYPLLPSKKVGQILYDFHIYGGNSGGPVYMNFEGRWRGNSFQLRKYQYIAGLVSKEGKAADFNNAPLQLAAIVPAEFIKDTINMLADK